MKLAEEIQRLGEGEELYTYKTKAAIYKAAKKVGLRVGTRQMDDKMFGVFVLGAEEAVKEALSEPSLVEQVCGLEFKKRRELFQKLSERYELCCGMNRTHCTCGKGDGSAGVAVETKNVDIPKESGWVPCAKVQEGDKWVWRERNLETGARRIVKEEYV